MSNIHQFIPQHIKPVCLIIWYVISVCLTIYSSIIAKKTSGWSYGTPRIRTDRLFKSPFVGNALTANIVAAFFLIVAIFYLLFGIIEIGLGASVFGYFDNVKSGAWWVGVVLILAILLQHKVYISYLSALAGCVASIIGAILDGISSAHFRSITACASQHSDTSGIMYWGNPEHCSLAVTCLSSAAVIVPDGCYCVSNNPRSCNEYTLSSFRRLIKDDCGNIMTTYSMTMTASCVFCVLCFIVALSRIILLELSERNCP